MTPTAPGAPRTAVQAALALVVLIWGSTFLAISVGNDTVPPVWAATLRLVLASLLLFALAAVRREPLPQGAALQAAVLYGVFVFGMNFPLLYWGEGEVPSGLSAILFATIPLETAILAHAFGLERLTAPKVLGALLALAGVAVLFSAQLRSDVAPARLVAVFAATWAASLGGVLLKRGPRLSAIMANAVGAAVGGAMCWVLSAALGEPHALPDSFRALFPILYLTLAGSLGAFVLWAWLLKHLDVTRLSYVSVVTPLIALLLGVLLRGERPGVAAFAGSVIVLAGVVIGVRTSAPRRTDRGGGDLAPSRAAE